MLKYSYNVNSTNNCGNEISVFDLLTVYTMFINKMFCLSICTISVRIGSRIGSTRAINKFAENARNFFNIRRNSIICIQQKGKLI